jgi:hypothetical protein
MSSLTSLKAYSTRLGSLLRVAPGTLYERQRALVAAGLISVEGEGRGPGSGVRADARTVAMLVISMMTTDSLAAAPERTRDIARCKAWGGACPLTGAADFAGAMTAIMERPGLAGRVAGVAVSRTSARAWVYYRDEGDVIGASEFSAGSELLLGIQVEAKMDDYTLAAIADDIAGKGEEP